MMAKEGTREWHLEQFRRFRKAAREATTAEDALLFTVAAATALENAGLTLDEALSNDQPT